MRGFRLACGTSLFCLLQLSVPAGATSSETQVPARVVAHLVRRYYYASRYVAVPSTFTAKLDAWQTAANKAIQDDNSPGIDYQCNLALTRLGAVDTFSEGDGEVADEKEAQYILSVSTASLVKIVNRITRCSDEDSVGEDAIILGCANTKGILLSAVDSASDSHIVLAHEFGHYKGIDTHIRAEGLQAYIMHKAADASSNLIGKTQCRCAFLLERGSNLNYANCIGTLSPQLLGYKPTGGYSDEYLVALGSGAVPFLISKLEEATSGSVRTELAVRLGAYPRADDLNPRAASALFKLATNLTKGGGPQDLNTIYYALTFVGSRGGAPSVEDLIALNRKYSKVVKRGKKRGIEVDLDYLRATSAFTGSLSGIAYSSSTAATAYLGELREERNSRTFPNPFPGRIAAAWKDHQVVREYGRANFSRNYDKMWGRRP